jgi:hypothetical protein
MAEIRNYTLNFGSGRPAVPALTCALRKLACAEIELRCLGARGLGFEKGTR